MVSLIRWLSNTPKGWPLFPSDRSKGETPLSVSYLLPHPRRSYRHRQDLRLEGKITRYIFVKTYFQPKLRRAQIKVGGRIAVFISRIPWISITVIQFNRPAEGGVFIQLT